MVRLNLINGTGRRTLKPAILHNEDGTKTLWLPLILWPSWRSAGAPLAWLDWSIKQSPYGGQCVTVRKVGPARTYYR